MTIDSAAWTGRAPAAAAGPQVCGEFRDEAAMEAAITRLSGVVDRSRISVRLPRATGPHRDGSPEAPMQADDAQNLRTLGASTAGAAMGLAAAGAVIASGGAALPALAAAAAASGAAVAAGELAGAVAGTEGGTEPQASAEGRSGAVVMVSAEPGDSEARATEILHAAGAIRVWRQDAG